MTKQEKFSAVFSYFEKYNPHPTTELNYTKPYELLVAVILSAQCTDKRVNMTTPEFFQKFPDAKTLSQGQFEDVQKIIKSVTFPNNKAKNLIGMAKMLTEEFKGVVPSDVNLLQKLPGVGRKTANVIASVVYNRPMLAVDTHVFRVANRIGLVKAKNPLETEKQLMKYIPEEKIPQAHHWLILHGRYICIARKPKCDICGIRDYCDYYKKIVKN